MSSFAAAEGVEGGSIFETPTPTLARAQRDGDRGGGGRRAGGGVGGGGGLFG